MAFEVEFSKRLDLFGAEIFAALNDKKVALEAQGKKLYNLSVGTPDFEPMPHIKQALCDAAMVSENWKYSLRDLPELLDTVCAYYKRRFDVDGITPDQIMSFNGSQDGMGHKWKWLAKIFAFFGVGVGLLGIGTFTQINGITSAVNGFFDANNEWTVDLFGRTYSWTVVITGILLTVCVALVIIGGIQRISSVAQVIVPFMAGCYVVAVVLILIFNFTAIPGALVEIVQSAFGLRAVTGGTIGGMLMAMQMGVARGIFSNEAGLGSAPIAAAAANSDSPAQQGLISMTGTVIDTIIICTMTGFAITITGTWNVGLQGVAVTTAAFQQGLPVPAKVSAFVLMMCLVFFAFTTILGWDYYSEKCLEYLVGGRQKVVKGYRWLYIVCVFIGPFMTVSAVWKIADIFNGLMAIPNLIAIVALSGVVVAETRKYMEQVAQGERAGAKKKAKGMENAQESEVVSNE